MKNVRTIWCVDSAFESNFAECGIRSPWETQNRPCLSCYKGATTIIPYPLVIEWLPGSNVVGDFSWPGCGRAIIKKRISDDMLKRFSMLELREIEMIQDHHLRVPKNKSKAKQRVWLPYDGEPLVELVPLCCFPESPRTTNRVAFRCDVCGRETTQLEGFELKEHRWDQIKQDLVPYMKPREAGRGLFISRNFVKDCPIFRVESFLSSIFCLNEFKNFIEDQGYTNIDFLEYGEVSDD